MEVPDNVQTRAISGLKAFVEGRTLGDSLGDRPDLTVRKLIALAALARHGEVGPGLVSNLNFDPNLWPTSAVLDWIDILKYSDAFEHQPELLADAKRIIRARLNFQGTTMGFSTEDSDYLWWLMVSVDFNAVRALGVLADDPAWAEDIPRILRGALGRQINGRWSTTTANAWGILALERYAEIFEAEPVSGLTAASFGPLEEEVAWQNAEESHYIDFGWAEELETLSVTHEGAGAPWALIQSRAALPLKETLSSGYDIVRTVTPVEQQLEGQWTKGDVLRISLAIDAQADMTWVVVDEPIPAGATILGSGLGGDSRFLTQEEGGSGRAWLAFEERRFDVFRAYYRYVPKGSFSVDYTIRLNNPGVFQLPTTRVEAMYAPEMFGELPNAPLEVAPR